MIFFGHTGIGYRLCRSWLHRPQYFKFVYPFFVGALLPDLIDKPLYYLLSWSSHAQGAELGLICGTRTFGHTLFFFIFVSLFCKWALKDQKWAALGLGILSHLVLDHAGDFVEYFIWEGKSFSPYFGWASDRWKGLFFPLLGPHFPIYPYGNWYQHFWHKIKPVFLLAEVLGLYWTWIYFYRVRVSAPER